MDFLKRQLFMIICGVVAAASIALGALGLSSMSKVDQQMQDTQALAQKLPNLARDSVNKEAIDAQEERLEDLRNYYDATLEWAYERNRREPLIPDAFPDPTRDQKLAFREAYFAKFDAFLEQLRAGMPATSIEIEEEAQKIKEEEKANQFFNLNAATGEEDEQPKWNRSGLITDYGARKIASARANLVKAQGIWMYASPSSFEVFESISAGITPETATLWDGQLSLWIQQDVVNALERVNERVAEELRARGERPWVGELPVKELVSIRTTPYLNPDAAANPPSYPTDEGPSVPPRSPDFVFTHTVSNDLYEVVQFSVKAVVDARMIPAVVDEICKDNFTTLVRLAYADVSMSPSLLDMSDRIYGSDPTVKVVMDFETVFFGELYRPLMPPAIRDSLGLPALEETQE